MCYARGLCQCQKVRIPTIEALIHQCLEGGYGIRRCSLDDHISMREHIKLSRQQVHAQA